MDTTDRDLLGRRRRRRHSAAFKQRVVGECIVPGVSIGAVALRHGLNANILRKWVIEGEHELEPARDRSRSIELPSECAFVPLQLSEPAVSAASPAAPDMDIRIDLRCEGVTLSVSWPLPVASDCAAWLRECLK